MSVACDGYQRGETVVLSLVARNPAGALTNPVTSTKITVTDPDATVVVNAANMVNDSTGLFHHDYTIAANADEGRYLAVYTAIDVVGGATRVTIVCSHFYVLDCTA